MSGVSAQMERLTGAVSPCGIRRSECCGCRGISMDAIDTYLREFALIINTIPAMVLDAGRLAKADRSALVIDLSSKPGGDDVGDTKVSEENRIQKADDLQKGYPLLVCR